MPMQTIYGIRIMLEIVIGITLFLVLFAHKLRVPVWAAAGLLSGCVLIVMISLLHTWSPQYHSGFWRLMNVLLYITLAYFLFRAIVRASPAQMIFVFFVTKSYLDDVTLFGKVLEELFHDRGGEYSIPLFLHVALLLATLPIILLFYIKIVRPLIDSHEQLPFWRYIWMLPLCFYCIYCLGIYPGFQNMEIFEQKGIILLPFAWAVGTFLSYYVVLRMVSETAKNAALGEKLHMSELRTHMQEEQYGLLQDNIRKTMRLRHDMRHHMLALEGYAHSSDYKGLINYIEQYLQSVGSEEGCICENHAVDAIVRFYAGAAKGNDVQVTTSLKLPRELPVPESDLCIVLGNLLENATEACERQVRGDKIIQIKAGLAGNMIAVTVKNSYEGEIVRIGEEFFSTKHSGEGIGTASVRCIAERYQGVAKFEYDGGMFQVSVLLNASVSVSSKKKILPSIPNARKS